MIQSDHLSNIVNEIESDMVLADLFETSKSLENLLSIESDFEIELQLKRSRIHR